MADLNTLDITLQEGQNATVGNLTNVDGNTINAALPSDATVGDFVTVGTQNGTLSTQSSSGIGNVSTSDVLTADQIIVGDGTTVVKNSGISSAGLATVDPSAIDGNLVSKTSTGSYSLIDANVAASEVVTTTDTLATAELIEGAGGKTSASSGIATANVVQASDNLTAGAVIVGDGTKQAVASTVQSDNVVQADSVLTDSVLVQGNGAKGVTATTIATDDVVTAPQTLQLGLLAGGGSGKVAISSGIPVEDVVQSTSLLTRSEFIVGASDGTTQVTSSGVELITDGNGDAFLNNAGGWTTPSSGGGTSQKVFTAGGSDFIQIVNDIGGIGVNIGYDQTTQQFAIDARNYTGQDLTGAYVTNRYTAIDTGATIPEIYQALGISQYDLSFQSDPIYFNEDPDNFIAMPDPLPASYRFNVSSSRGGDVWRLFVRAYGSQYNQIFNLYATLTNELGSASIRVSYEYIRVS